MKRCSACGTTNLGAANSCHLCEHIFDREPRSPATASGRGDVPLGGVTDPSRRKAGSGARRWFTRRHLHNLAWVLPLVLLVLIRAHRTFELPSEDADALTDLVGGVVLSAGMFLRLCARGWKYEAPGRRLVTDGPYGYVRHPLYAASCLIGLGLCLMVGVAWFTCLYFVWFWAAHASVIRREETQLAARWPQAYSRYAARVARFVPRWQSLRRGCRFWPRRWEHAMRKEADSLCLWPLAAIAVEIAEDAGSPAMRAAHTAELRLLIAVAVGLLLAWAWLKRRPQGARPSGQGEGQVVAA